MICKSANSSVKDFRPSQGD